MRRLIFKAILRITKDVIQQEAGSLQLYADQEAACESGILSMKSLFEDSETEAIILVDASNAFNCLNREVALRNIQILCPVIAPVLINTYRKPSKLFIDGEYTLSQEDLLAMAMYAIATMPLIRKLKSEAAQI